MDKSRAVPCNSMLPPAISRTKHKATSTNCAPAIVAAASASHRASLVPSAAASSGPRAAAVRLNWTSVKRVSQAGREGTR